MKLYQALARTMQAYITCCDTDNSEWARKHSDRLDALCLKHLPSGSGFDSGTQLCYDKCEKEQLAFDSAFHPMNEHGMYVDWVYFRVLVTPSLAFGFNLDVQFLGDEPDDEVLVDLIAESFQYDLDSELTE